MLDIFFSHYVYLFWMKIWIRVGMTVNMKLKSMFFKLATVQGKLGYKLR